MELCEQLGGMTLAEMDARMGASELALWKAKVQVEKFVHQRMDSYKLNFEQALDHARADHRSVMERKAKHKATR